MKSLFGASSKNDTKVEGKSGMRSSLEAFKAKADTVVEAEAVDKITGGLMSDCHTGCAP
jgi:hypothetical protein